MKKIPFYFFVLFYVIGYDTAMCQHAVVQANYPNDVERSIVREYVYPATVSYVETAVEHYFAYADATMTVTNCEISHDLYVTDLALHGQFAYFCGYNTVSGTGVWGWFDVNTLIGGALSYYLHDGFVCSSLYVDSLFDLDVFEEKGQLHIVTVGSATDGANKKRPCLIDITGTEGIATGWNYQMGISECQGQLFNRLTRVCVTDNYIVAAGKTNPGLCSEGYRFHLRGNLFSASGPQDSLYTFTRGNGSPDHDGENMAMTHTTGDYFTSAVYTYTNLPSQTDGILVNVYDIAQVLAVPAASPVYSKYVPIPSTATCTYTIHDLIYSQTSNSLALLSSGCFWGIYNGSFITELSLPLPTIIKPVYLQDIYLTSLDRYNGQQSMLAQGYDGNNIQTSTYYTQPLSTSPACVPDIPYYTSDAEYAAKTFYCPYINCTATFDCGQFNQGKPIVIGNDFFCEQP